GANADRVYETGHQRTSVNAKDAKATQRTRRHRKPTRGLDPIGQHAGRDVRGPNHRSAIAFFAQTIAPSALPNLLRVARGAGGVYSASAARTKAAAISALMAAKAAAR